MHGRNAWKFRTMILLEMKSSKMVSGMVSGITYMLLCLCIMYLRRYYIIIFVFIFLYYTKRMVVMVVIYYNILIYLFYILLYAYYYVLLEIKDLHKLQDGNDDNHKRQHRSSTMHPTNPKQKCCHRCQTWRISSWFLQVLRAS